jgi:hypothetical protein
MTAEQLPLTPATTPRRSTALVPVHCRRCRRYLLDVLVGAGVLCPHCSVWTMAGATMPARAGNRSERGLRIPRGLPHSPEVKMTP